MRSARVTLEETATGTCYQHWDSRRRRHDLSPRRVVQRAACEVLRNTMRHPNCNAKGTIFTRIIEVAYRCISAVYSRPIISEGRNRVGTCLHESWPDHFTLLELAADCYKIDNDTAAQHAIVHCSPYQALAQRCSVQTHNRQCQPH